MHVNRDVSFYLVQIIDDVCGFRPAPYATLFKQFALGAVFNILRKKRIRMIPVCKKFFRHR